MYNGNVTRAEHKVKVGTIDSAGIDKLIKDSKGAVIVAMAAWCLPCREELPRLVKLNDKYKSQGLRMIGISLDLDGPSAIQPVLEKARVDFPVYWAGEEAMKDLKIRAIPLFLFIKDGAIVEKVLGARHKTFLEKKIHDLLELKEK
jgi:thiol-disulfide isomerase/thioredoxin